MIVEIPEFLPDAERKRFRDREYRRAKKNGTWRPEVKQPVEVRLLARLDRDGPVPAHAPELGPCWLWTGSTTPEGYGKIRVGGSLLYVHRVALMIALRRELAPGMYACHKCDTKSCARPFHLYEGTVAENTREAWERILRPKRLTAGQLDLFSTPLATQD